MRSCRTHAAIAFAMQMYLHRNDRSASQKIVWASVWSDCVKLKLFPTGSVANESERNNSLGSITAPPSPWPHSQMLRSCSSTHFFHLVFIEVCVCAISYAYATSIRKYIFLCKYFIMSKRHPASVRHFWLDCMCCVLKIIRHYNYTLHMHNCTLHGRMQSTTYSWSPVDVFCFCM